MGGVTIIFHQLRSFYLNTQFIYTDIYGKMNRTVITQNLSSVSISAQKSSSLGRLVRVIRKQGPQPLFTFRKMANLISGEFTKGLYK